MADRDHIRIDGRRGMAECRTVGEQIRLSSPYWYGEVGAVEHWFYGVFELNPDSPDKLKDW
jgi:hypothetical protein